MRITPEQRRTIVDETARIFGADARVRLFGSRVDDGRRGGDIDLHIQSHGTPQQLLERELRLQARLLRRLGDRRIDIVVQNPDRVARAIDKAALHDGIRL